MKKGIFKVLVSIENDKANFVELKGSFEIHGVLMINKTPNYKTYSVTHIKSGYAYIHGLSLKQARSLVKETKGYTCWKAKDYTELKSKCYSRRWKGKLKAAIKKVVESHEKKDYRKV